MSDLEHTQTISYIPNSHLNNPLDILEAYLESLTSKTIINDTKNAVIRYLVPSLYGPIPTAAKRRPVASEEVESALNFFKSHVTLAQLADSPNLAVKTLEQLGSSPAQRERVRRNLRELVDWAREQQYLPLPPNPIPDDLCKHIKVGQFEGCRLRPANARQIYANFLNTLEKRTEQTDLTNAIIRFFVPGCGGPNPYHKPALESEIKAGLEYLETVPLEYLNEAPVIASEVLKRWNLTKDHGTRVRYSLNSLLAWAREQCYLPDPDHVAPWGGDHISPQIVNNLEVAESVVPQRTVAQSYQHYRQYLEQANRISAMKALQTVVIHYIVPACGGPQPAGKKASPQETQIALDYLQSISLEKFDNIIDLVEQKFDSNQLSSKRWKQIRSRLRTWLQWNVEHGYSQHQVESTPEFRTFYSPAQPKQHSPGHQLHENRAPAHALGARQFPNDYINPGLQQQIENYQHYRLRSDTNRRGIAPGTLKTEMEFIDQVLGWLHRYESVPLDQLRFESLISVNQLIFRIEDRSYDDYLRWKEQGTQQASDKAHEDCLRVQRYLEFTGSAPNSQKRRLSNVIAIAKFLYRDVIGMDEFPKPEFIPVIRRLIKYQDDLGNLASQTPSSIKYRETSVKWNQAVETMLKQRRRADQTIVYLENSGISRGYQATYRTDRSVAHELQRFLSIAFCIVIPSRSRTFYDLRIGETFKEGILTENEFLSVAQLKELGSLEAYQDKVRFYVHHKPEDYKTGRNMSRALLDNDYWWAEIQNLEFGQTTLYDYIRRWLNWGRTLHGPVSDNYFFRGYKTLQPINGGTWNARIKSIFKFWTGIPVPPKNIRKMFASTFPGYEKSAAVLMQHSEQIHHQVYDMRLSIQQMQPVMDANVQFIKNIVQHENTDSSLEDRNLIEK